MTASSPRLAVMGAWIAAADALLLVSLGFAHRFGFVGGLLTGILIAVLLILLLSIGAEFRRVRTRAESARLDDIDPLGGVERHS